VWYPTILTLIASTLGYLIYPDLMQNTPLMIAIVLMSFWGCTLLNFFGMRLSSLVSTLGSLVGTLLPMGLIILLAGVWLFQGNSPQISLKPNGLIPSFQSLSEIVIFTQIVYSLLGVEMSAVHALDVKNPKKDYPKALLISAIIILISLILASLAIAIIVPPTQLSHLTGIIQAFQLFSNELNIKGLEPIIAGAIVIGGICAVATWIIGPTKGLFAAADDGLLPSFLAKTNRFGVPYAMLLMQAIICSFLTLIYILFPTLENGYFALSTMAAQLSMLMYAILFLAAIRLRYNQKDVYRPFKLPGNNLGMWLIAGMGFSLSLFIIFLGFVPPSHLIELQDIKKYELCLGISLTLILMPLIFIHTPKKLMKKTMR
jgi:amino acid transporter